MGKSITESLIIPHHLLTLDQLVVLLLELLEMTNGEFEDVSFLQSGNIFSFILESSHKDVFKLIQAPVDTGSSLSFQQRLSNL
jgi:hypothetical protein